MKNSVDVAYIKQYLNGNIDAFGILYEKHYHMVYKAVQKTIKFTRDVRDLVQDVFLKLSQQLHTFRNESTFHHWLFRIAHNITTNYIISLGRKQNKRQEYYKSHDPSELIFRSPFYSDPLMFILYNELRDRIKTFFLTKLSHGERECMMLFRYGLTSNEVAKRLDKTVANVCTQRCHSIKKLKKYLREIGYERDNIHQVYLPL